MLGTIVQSDSHIKDFLGLLLKWVPMEEILKKYLRGDYLWQFVDIHLCFFNFATWITQTGRKYCSFTNVNKLFCSSLISCQMVIGLSVTSSTHSLEIRKCSIWSVQVCLGKVVLGNETFLSQSGRNLIYALSETDAWCPTPFHCI